jgi:hypothetical protein
VRTRTWAFVGGTPERERIVDEMGRQKKSKERRMRLRKRLLAAGLACVMMAALNAVALTGGAYGLGQVEATYLGVYYNGIVTHVGGSSYYAGFYEFEWEDASGPIGTKIEKRLGDGSIPVTEIPAKYNVDGESYLDMFCIDFEQPITGVATTFDVAPLSAAPIPDLGDPNRPMGNLKALYLARLWTYVDLTVGAITPDLTGANGLTAAEAEAMQAAIWEIVTETDYSQPFALTTGNMKWSSVPAVAAGWLTVVQDDDAWIGKTVEDSLGALVNVDTQDFVGLFKVQVPEPSSMLLAGFGLLGLLIRPRRKRS